MDPLPNCYVLDREQSALLTSGLNLRKLHCLCLDGSIDKTWELLLKSKVWKSRTTCHGSAKRLKYFGIAEKT